MDVCTPKTGSVCQGEAGVVGVSKDSERSPLAMVAVGQLLASGTGRRWVMRADRECV